MKNKKIFLIIVLLIVLGVLGSCYYNQNQKNKYYNRKVIETQIIHNTSESTSENTLENENLNIQLSNFEKLENNLKFDLIFSQSGNEKLNDAMFDIFIYDDNGNVIWNGIPSKKYNYYKKWFSQEMYGKADYMEIQNHFVGAGPYAIDDISNEDNLKYSLNCNLDSNYEINSNVNICLLNLKYQLVGNSNYNNLDNVELKFKIDVSTLMQ